MTSEVSYLVDLSFISADTRRIGFNSSAAVPQSLVFASIRDSSLEALYLQDVNVTLLSSGLMFGTPSRRQFLLYVRRCLVSGPTTSANPATRLRLNRLLRAAVVVADCTFRDVSLSASVLQYSDIALSRSVFTTSGGIGDRTTAGSAGGVSIEYPRPSGKHVVEV